MSNILPHKILIKIFILFLIIFVILVSLTNIRDRLYNRFLLILQKDVIQKIDLDEISQLYSELQKNGEYIENTELYQKYHNIFRNYKNKIHIIKYVYLVIIDSNVKIEQGNFRGIYFVDQNKQGEFGYTPPNYDDIFVKKYKVYTVNGYKQYIKNIYHFKYGQQKSTLIQILKIKDDTIYLGLDFDLNILFNVSLYFIVYLQIIILVSTLLINLKMNNIQIKTIVLSVSIIIIFILTYYVIHDVFNIFSISLSQFVETKLNTQDIIYLYNQLHKIGENLIFDNKYLMYQSFLKYLKQNFFIIENIYLWFTNNNLLTSKVIEVNYLLNQNKQNEHGYIPPSYSEIKKVNLKSVINNNKLYFVNNNISIPKYRFIYISYTPLLTIDNNTIYLGINFNMIRIFGDLWYFLVIILLLTVLIYII